MVYCVSTFISFNTLVRSNKLYISNTSPDQIPSQDLIPLTRLNIFTRSKSITKSDAITRFNTLMLFWPILGKRKTSLVVFVWKRRISSVVFLASTLFLMALYGHQIVNILIRSTKSSTFMNSFKNFSKSTILKFFKTSELF